MEYKEALHAVQDLIFQSHQLIEQKGFAPDYKALDYGRNGVSSLFEQFKHAAGWADYFSSQIGEVESEKADIVLILRGWQASNQGKADVELSRKLQAWISNGMSWNERGMMSKINFSEDFKACQEIEQALECLNAKLDVVKMRLRRLEEFKYSAQLLEKTLNFGHALQELR